MVKKLYSGTRLQWEHTYLLLEQMGKSLEGRQVFLALMLKRREEMEWGEPVIVKVTQSDSIRLMPAVTERCCLECLSHIGIPNLIETYRGEGYYGIAQTLMPGYSIKEWLGMGKMLSGEQFFQIVQGLGEILIYLHSLDTPIVYRDLKPEHVLWDQKGQVSLVDFDGAAFLDSRGVIVGNQAYSAPELFARPPKGIRPDVRQDIYSFGRLMDKLWGHTDKSGMSWIAKSGIRGVILGCTSKCAGRRPDSMRAVCDCLEQIRNKGKRRYLLQGQIACMSLVLVVAFALAVGNRASAKATESELLPVVFLNEKGQRILIRYDAVYEPAGDLHMVLPKDFFAGDKKQELTVILRDLKTGERRERTLTLQ